MAYTNLPLLSFAVSSAKLHSLASKGNLINNYIPFRNLVDTDYTIVPFRTDQFTDNSGNQTYNINSPVNIEIQPSFDGSVNLILNNDSEKPKLINSRFSVQENDTFEIVDHRGNRDSNLYDNSKLDLDTRLYKTISKIAKLSFNGIANGGKLPCGSYHFYFKLADNDGNETDFISESGVVTCHIGQVNDPRSIRMGMQNEDSKKIAKFTLSNIDSSYDYVKVYYTRTTSDNSGQDIVTTHYIDEKYLIFNDKSEINITGFENHTDVASGEINVMYEVVDTVKAQAQCQNMLFFGNVNKPNIDYVTLERIAQNFTPTIVQDTNVGNMSNYYVDSTGFERNEYYNVDNLYYKLGYWPEEYYRFGIVYILSDYTLSPVFNTRGVEFTTKTFTHTTNPSYDEDGLVFGTTKMENIKGVVKIPKLQVMFDNGTKPLGIKFTNTNTGDDLVAFNKQVKGYFLVRQERVPTIYAQGLSINKTKDNYGNIPVIKGDSGNVTQSFLNTSKILSDNGQFITTPFVENKAAIIPEAIIRAPIFNQLFTASDFKITSVNKPTSDNILDNIGNNYFLTSPNGAFDTSTTPETVNLTIVNENTKLTTNGTDYFSTVAGEATQAWDAVNVAKRMTTDSAANLNVSDRWVRGLFGGFVGLGTNSMKFGTLFNVRSNNYEASNTYRDQMYVVRKNSSDPYFPISDRLELTESPTVYRGDCYVCNYTHRMQQNFIDPDLPTNTNIVDGRSWIKNFWVHNDGVNRVLTTFKVHGTYSQLPVSGATGTTNGAVTPPGEEHPPGSGFMQNISATIGEFFGGSTNTIRGVDKINRGDVNAVPLGHWVTFKVMSNVNLSMRDVDSSYPAEEAMHGKKRSFYPLQELNPKDKLPESNILNGAANVTLSKKANFIVPDVPFIKNYFGNRILYSDVSSNDAFKNGYRVFQGGHYRDYTKQYGAIVDMKEWNGNLFTTMEHGILLIPVNERALGGEGAGGSVYINTSNVLPENPKVISQLYGSIWPESVVKTQSGIYGIDTVAKKIWKSDGQTLETISDFKVQKFLNDNINLKESDQLPTIGLRNVKTHYNKFKGDIMFTFYNGDKEWNLCYNEKLGIFTTYYSWIPSHSANISNIFFTFDKNTLGNTFKKSTPLVLLSNNGVLSTISNTEWQITGNNPTVVVRCENVITSNGWWTVSFDLRGTQDIAVNLDVDICDTSAGGATTNTLNTFQRVSFTANITNYSESVYNFFDINCPQNVWYRIANIKVEKGHVATDYSSKIWKHGQSGIFSNAGTILPTKWYGDQKPFEFEFIVAEVQGVQKIFNNLKLISNKAAPQSFDFEIVGETYNWFQYKPIVEWIYDYWLHIGTLTEVAFNNAYKYVLQNTMATLEANPFEIPFPTPFGKEGSTTYKIPKLPYLLKYIKDGRNYTSYGQYGDNTSETTLVYDKLLNEERMHMNQVGNDMRKYGRVKGNMMYMEDAWNLEIRPMVIKYAYMSGSTLSFTNEKETRIRDKYLKVRVKYTGNDLAIIQGIKTTFTISYS